MKMSEISRSTHHALATGARNDAPFGTMGSQPHG